MSFPNDFSLRTSKPSRRCRGVLIVLALLTLALACRLPGLGRDAGEPVDGTPAASVGPLPPAVVEVSPLPGSELPLSGAVTLYFNQEMDRPSVEAAVVSQPVASGSFEWLDDSTVTYTPVSPWEPETPVALTVGETARAANGLPMQAAVLFDYAAAPYLRLTQMLPAEDTFEVDPTSAVVAAFNQPVVPLGADLEAQAPAFTLSPAAAGRGEWLNTSTYIFYPEPALDGGVVYAVQLNAALHSTNGAPLEGDVEWMFSTTTPRVENAYPAQGDVNVRLDAEVRVSFNQPMDAGSVEADFALREEGGAGLSGEFEWEEDFTGFTFTPDELLGRSTRYEISLSPAATGLGGTPLESGFQTAFTTAGPFAVLETTPASNEELATPYASVTFRFNAPIASENAADFIAISPVADVSVDWSGKSLWLHGPFIAQDTYTVTVKAGLQDIWGSMLAEDYTMTFKTPPLTPGLVEPSSDGVLFVAPDDPGITVQAVNVSQVDVSLGSVPLSEFFHINDSQADYNERSVYRPAGVETRRVSLDLAPNRSHITRLPLAGGEDLLPGVYWYALEEVPLPDRFVSGPPTFAVVSYIHLVLKVGPTDALVWAVDTRAGDPVEGQTVTVYDVNGNAVASGETDAEGVFAAPVRPSETTQRTHYAVMGSPGGEFFSLASTGWNDGISSWDFGYSLRVTPPRTSYYVYTDRPIYRPGDTVHFRVVARQAFYGSYQAPGIEQVSINVFGARGEELENISLPLNEFGTAQGSYTLSAAAAVGYYRLEADESYYYGVQFQVAEYRKPEIDLAVGFSEDQVEGGESVEGEVSARFFFDAPAGGTDLSWSSYVREGYFYLPGYRVGPVDGFSYGFGYGGLGLLEEEGAGQTSEDGTFSVPLSTSQSDRLQVYTLEVVVEDESGFPVASRDTLTVHPAPFYIGTRADTWVGRAEEEMGFEVLVVDWDQNPAGSRNLSARFSQVEWVRVGTNQYNWPEYERRETDVSAGAFATDSQGQARLAFTPPKPGFYQLEVSGGGALTQSYVWVGGPGRAVWPDQRQYQIELIADKETYQPGDTAQVFVPNPFDGPAQALVTLERGEVISHQLLTISGSGTTLPVELDEASAPNVYLTVSLFGSGEEGQPLFRFGIVNLEVSPQQQELIVAVVGDPERAAPGETVSFTIKVTDADGTPVQGEFSLSVVDEAVLALQDPFEEDILTAFYKVQPLGVVTSASLIADSDRFGLSPGGIGGGGGGDEAAPPLRDDFKDTAYWNAQVVTDEDGLAVVEARLPDNLTTWRVLVRGLTKDTLVGEAISEVVSTKTLLVRPVTPRFFVEGDHALIAAVVHNNSAQDLEVSVALETKGFLLDDPGAALTAVDIPAGGRARLEWWGTVEAMEGVELTFAAEGGGFSDLVIPEAGALPVLHYIAPQTFATSGILDAGGERLELVSLPRRFDPTGGGLTLELASSLAGAMLEGLAELEESPYTSAEQTVSRFLPNLEAYLALKEFGLDAPAFSARLERTLETAVAELENAQNYDGGWGWGLAIDRNSHPYVTAYVLLGLLRAEQAGIQLGAYTVDDAVDYLSDYLAGARLNWLHGWEYDRAAFIYYVLGQAASPLSEQAAALYAVRAQMNPWSRALLALTLEQVSPGSEQAAALFSDLTSGAVRSATGVHWEQTAESWQNMSSTAFTNAVVVYALAQRDPASPLMADAVRYLMASRGANGSWGGSYSTAWTIMALTEVMKGTGELGGEFAFSASLNDVPLAAGQAGGTDQFTPVVAEIGLEGLLAGEPNALTVQRDPGAGRLYYRALLAVSRPVGEVAPLNRGVSVSRVYYPTGEACTEEGCDPITSARAGDLVTVRVTLTLPHSVYYLAVEDLIPAGTEVLNASLKTSQQGFDQGTLPSFNPRNPYRYGWGWWYFGRPQVYDERVVWMAEFLPAGTYELTYTLVVLQPGEYQVIPARAWQLYFPEVQGNSAGEVFEVLP